MPHFYFDIRDGSALIRDLTGQDCANLARAQCEAGETAADIGRDHGFDREWSVTVEVQDNAHIPLVAVTASLKFEDLT